MKMENYNDSVKFKNWVSSLENNGIKIASISEVASIHKKNGEMLFTLVNIDAKGPDGNPILPTVLIRGHFVSVLTCLVSKSSKKHYFLLVKQRRVADGSIFFEHPAGMCDSEADPYYVALKEVKEETGLSVKKEQLELLWDSILFSSPGLLDEGGYFFSCEVEMSDSEIDEYRSKHTGAKDESEFIETFVCPQEDIFKYLKNANGIMSTLLYARKKGFVI
jgi:8-oxo-dGTP pyrophosphatase MutT (NUDIX family)